ncbi:heme utilization cystosolic carrier protein HutX [Marinobacterium mangrovicola]|uniref:heme utilization cystosolic carrier protein HutX n=1 Tax=Marinobacterium mangrovicola TaxID=1476959 RepID=UPI001043D78A|nr:heme utilization cystosolic carrier protein HutX [Marinobacterium mangrovicola]
MTELAVTELAPTGKVAVLPGDRAQGLLEALTEWGELMTIVQHGGSVFEFKGPFPKGQLGHGYFNLVPEGAGFQGHLALNLVSEIRFQESLRGGRESYAFVFCDAAGEVIFKVFLGRDEYGSLFSDQITAFQQVKEDALANEAQPLNANIAGLAS